MDTQIWKPFFSEFKEKTAQFYNGTISQGDTKAVPAFMGATPGFSKARDTFFSSFRIAICCGQCFSHFPHCLHKEAFVRFARHVVHIRYSLIPVKKLSVWQTL